MNYYVNEILFNAEKRLQTFYYYYVLSYIYNKFIKRKN